MSWFSSYFSFPAPYDAQKHPPSKISQSAVISDPAREKRILEEPVLEQTSSQGGSSPNSTQSQRRNRNKVIFGAGLGFFAFSLLITKRSFARRRFAAQARFYTDAPGHQAEQSTKVSGAMEAVEALNIATINVLSLAMMGIGGSMWYYDINSMDDARKMLRGGLGVDGTGRSEKEAEEDFEEWIASTLARKEIKDAKRDIQRQQDR